MKVAEQVTSRAGLIERIRHAYQDFSSVIASIPFDMVTAPEMVGEWSVRDVIAHIGGDEMWMAGQLEALRFGVLPTPESCYGIDLPPPPEMDWSQDGRNAWQRQRFASLSLDDVRGMARESHTRLLTVMNTLEDKQLAQPLAIAQLKTVGWIRPPKDGERAYPLWEWLRGVTYQHYADHADTIRTIVRANSKEEQ